MKIILLTAALLTFSPFAMASEQFQTKVRIQLDGCIVKDKVSNCGGNNEFIEEQLALNLECPKGEKEPCEQLLGRFEKEYTLHWSDQNLTRKVSLMLMVSAFNLTSSKHTYLFDAYLAPSDGKENDVRKISLVVDDVSGIRSTSTALATEWAPLPGDAKLETWTDATLSDFYVVPLR